MEEWKSIGMPALTDSAVRGNGALTAKVADEKYQVKPENV